MRLINFLNSSKLNRLREQMGAELHQLDASNQWDSIDDNKLATLLKTGEAEIDLEEIKLKDGVFEYKGRKVIVYIRDQYAKYHSRGYRFHLSDCSTMSAAFQNKRNSRYVVSLRTDGYFKVNLLDGNEVVKKDLIEPLHVCKNCLQKVNYQKYKAQPFQIKSKIYENFNLDEYFKQYLGSSLKPHNYRSANTAPINKYNNTFKSTSRSLKERDNYTCNECGYSMNSPELRKYAHVHHVDGDKSNDSPSNLKLLCIACHAEKGGPGHENIKSTPDYHQFKTVRGF